MLDKTEKSGEPLKRVYFTFLGKKVQKNIYDDYIHFLTKFGKSNKFTFEIYVAKTGDNWYKEVKGDKPFIWFNKKNLKVNLGMVSLKEIYIGKFGFGFGILKNL